MKVDVLASTQLRWSVMEGVYGFEFAPDDLVTDADALAESGGRLCYRSFNRPNPATATNAGYLANILSQQHYSVLEHASVTFSSAMSPARC